MRRALGWERAFDAYLAERQAMPFAWGKHDCCRFACGGLVAQGLPDPMRGLRPYSTARGAAGALRRLGGMEAAATARMALRGYSVAPVAFAQRGCMVLADVETPAGPVEPALGLVAMDGRRAMFATAVGLTWRPLAACRMAWGVS